MDRKATCYGVGQSGVTGVAIESLHVQKSTMLEVKCFSERGISWHHRARMSTKALLKSVLQNLPNIVRYPPSGTPKRVRLSPTRCPSGNSCRGDYWITGEGATRMKVLVTQFLGDLGSRTMGLDGRTAATTNVECSGETFAATRRKKLHPPTGERR